MTSVYTVTPQQMGQHRYQVQWFQHNEWHTKSDSYRTKMVAKYHARIFARLGHTARVIDTRWDSS